MEEKFCKDCPRFRIVADEDEMTYLDNACILNPHWEEIGNPQGHYCYLGRQIMAEREAFEKAKESFEVKDV